MGRSPKLNEYEKGQIDGLFGVGKSYREIGRRIGRSHNVVMNYLKNKDEYGRKKSSGRRSIISEETRTQLFQDLTNTGDSINTVKNRNNVVASKSAVYRAVKKKWNICLQTTAQSSMLERTSHHQSFAMGCEQSNLVRRVEKCVLF